MPAPTIEHSDQNCTCTDCANASKLGFLGRVILAALALIVVLALCSSARAREGRKPEPIAAPPALLAARAACPDTASILRCRTALVHAMAALRWQRHARIMGQHPYGVQHALRLASAIYSIPIGQLRRVGTCESHLHPLSKNRSSTAAGLFQFLNTTWRRAGIPGFTPYDPYASAIAAARLVKRDGSWREWSCGFRA